MLHSARLCENFPATTGTNGGNLTFGNYFLREFRLK